MVIKKSEGNNVFWIGYKGHLAVGTSDQYILQSLFSSDSLKGRKAAITLLKVIHEQLLPLSSLRYQTMDVGYDYDLIYELAYQMVKQSLKAYIRRNEGGPICFDKHIAPTYFSKHSYCYDSF